MNKEPHQPKTIKLLIAGLGNSLLMDDGVGIHAVRALQVDPIEGALAVEVGTAVFDAVHLFEAAEKVIVLDAVQAQNPPGTVYELTLDAVQKKDAFHSMHEIGLREIFRILPDESKPQLVVLGMEPHTIDYGLELSPVVQKALPGFVETIRSVARRMLKQGEGEQT